MSCSSEQIAEKKRLAQERLRTRKTEALLIAENKRLALERLHARTKQIGVDPQSRAKSSPSSSNSASLFIASLHPSTSTHPVGKIKINEIRPKPYDKRPASSHTNENTSAIVNQSVAPIFRKSISCVCSLVSATRFVVTPSGFHAKLIEVFKQIPSRSYGIFYSIYVDPF